ncbi:hypothetical protein EIZ39_25780 [Ammoniphilus sp. CFH 90114]|nr:hypothetical protein EIZ39_25780 [Ammoniphilus sp. CFH 90114]
MDERKRLFSKHRGKTLDLAISSISQMILNEERNPGKHYDSSLDFSTRKKGIKIDYDPMV